MDIPEMEYAEVFKCLSDPMRLRILHLLAEGPLCVCHVQEILEEGQVRTSKQLAYLRQHGLVTATRCGAWMVYALAEPTSPILRANLNWLRAESEGDPTFSVDCVKRAKVVARLGAEGTDDCPASVVEEICGCGETSCCGGQEAVANPPMEAVSR